jgi:hypothetical protein
MKVVSCDPDTQTPAFALYEAGMLASWEMLFARRTHWLEKLQPLIDSWKPHLLVIENQFIPVTKTANQDFPKSVQSIFALVAARGMIEGLFQLSGVPGQLVEPFDWQRTLGGSGLGRTALKERSLLKASDIAGCPIANHNLADAINIGYWWTHAGGRGGEWR